MKPVEVLVTKLRNDGAEPVKTSSGWEARCPAHNDARASLGISEAKDGKALVLCRAGCGTPAVLAKLGLAMADLYPSRQASRDAEAIYEYRDAAGDLRYRKIRYPGKKFVQCRPDGEDGWVWGLRSGWYSKGQDGWHLVKGARDSKSQPSPEAKWFPETPKLLYRLEAVVTAAARGATVLFVEGEKDCDNADKIDVPATTTGGAAEPWQDSYGEALRGAKVVFIPDADDAGRKLFERYAPNLARYVGDLRRLDLPDGFKDLSEWLGAGHTRGELDALIAAAPVWNPRGPVAEILDVSPETIRRPLSLVGGRAYAASWVSVRLGEEDSIAAVILRDDGQLFADVPVPDATALRELGVKIDLPHVPDPDRILSGAGVKRFMAGERCDPGEVFARVKAIVTHYMDFDRSLGTQSELVELSALYVLTTYLLDAFNVVGYLWPNGDKGTGKTKKLVVITDLAYLGILVLAGGSYASLRDLADYGACLGFDDAEGVMDVRRADPDKRALFLAGNRRGTYITLKEPCGDGWRSRRVHAFCPRLFSAINLPDEVLASRTIVVPLVRSADKVKANRDPADHDAWPESRRQLIDDLWALGLANLAVVKTYDRKVVDRVPLVGRNLEPWRAVLAVALWLQERHGVPEIFDRMVNLAVRYQSERVDIEVASPVRVAIAAMQHMLAAAEAASIEFSPTELAAAMNRIAHDEEIEHTGETFTTAQKAGALLRRQRVERAQRTAAGKRWHMSRGDLDALARAYGMPGIDSPIESQLCRDADSAGNADLRESPSNSTDSVVGEAAQVCRDADSAGNAGPQEPPSNSTDSVIGEATQLCRDADSAGNAGPREPASNSTDSVIGEAAQVCRDADSAGNADLRETPSSVVHPALHEPGPGLAVNDLEWSVLS
jgi:hypothetical protein